MKITVFTSNQPRHLALVERLTDIADEVFAILECNTVFPGQVADFFSKSKTMRNYFSGVMSAEQHYFGGVRFSPQRASCMAIRAGDLNRLTKTDLAPALSADAYVVFGSSFIKGWLVDHLVERQAINIHMGLSPYYRGSSCNFWALYDNNPAMVGATIHLLTQGLDSGPMIRHAVPKLFDEDPFRFTMKAVIAAFDALTDTITDGRWRDKPAAPQNQSLELRYTRNSDFTDDVVTKFLSRNLRAEDLENLYCTSAKPKLRDPIYF